MERKKHCGRLNFTAGTPVIEIIGIKRETTRRRLTLSCRQSKAMIYVPLKFKHRSVTTEVWSYIHEKD